MRRAFVHSTFLLCAVFSARAAAEESAGEPRTYVVQRGDRFESLSNRFGVTPGEIRTANPGAYGIRCLRPFSREGRDGERRAYCGRPRYYLIAGKTLVIPQSRLLVESENVRLDSEIVALRAELAQARREADAERQEIESLREERDRFAAANTELAKANTAMAEKNNEFASRYSEARAVADAKELSDRSSEIESRENTVVIVAVVCTGVGVVVLALVFVWWSRRPLRNLERDRASLELSRKGVTTEAEDLVRRRQIFEKEETRRRLALTEEEGKQRTLRAELTRWKDELDERNNRVLARKREHDERETSLEGRESACQVREEASARLKTELEAQRLRQEARAEELASKEHGVEALRQSLASQRARQDLKDVKQTEREEDLKKGFDDLNTRAAEVHADLGAKQAELEQREAEIDARVRMFDEDIQPQLATHAEREESLRRQEEELRRREETVVKQETDCGLRLEELQEAMAQIEGRETALSVGEQELERRQYDLANAQDAFEQGLIEARKAFEKEMAEARAALEAEVSAAQHLVEIAGGLKKAQNTISLAKRKKSITQALDEREAKLNEREAKLNEREEDLRKREEREDLLSRLTRSKEPRKPTIPPDFPPLPVNGVPSGTDLRFDDVPTELRLPEPPAGDVDPSGITHIDPPGSEPAMDVSTCLCPICNHEIALGMIEHHLSRAHPDESTGSKDTGPHIPVAAEPSHEESGFYCNTCHRAFSAEEYAADHADHDEQITPDSSGQT